MSRSPARGITSFPASALRRGVVPLMFSSALFACEGTSDERFSPTAPAGRIIGVMASDARSGGDGEAAMRELDRSIPGFGGIVLTYPAPATGRRRDPSRPLEVRVLLTSAGNPGLARRTVRERLTRQGYHVQRISVLPATYTFGELSRWRDALGTAIRGRASGTVSLDADEGANRLTVGVETAADTAPMRRSLALAVVPSAAVVIRVSGRVVKQQAQNTDLRAAFRPQIPGGVIIGQSGCTLGFNVLQGGDYQFFTASHCTTTEFQPDGGSFYQPVGGIFVGSESTDPVAHPGATCKYGYDCRYSDAALVRWSPSSLAEFGKIAATTNQTGSTTIDPARPRLRLIGVRRGIYEGNVVDKIGVATGWTYGNVTKTCIDIFPVRERRGRSALRRRRQLHVGWR